VSAASGIFRRSSLAPPTKKKHPGHQTQVFFSPSILQGHHLIDGRIELPKAEVGQKGHYRGLG
jgi:hypothetical protein